MQELLLQCMLMLQKEKLCYDVLMEQMNSDEKVNEIAPSLRLIIERTKTWTALKQMKNLDAIVMVATSSLDNLTKTFLFQLFITCSRMIATKTNGT